MPDFIFCPNPSASFPLTCSFNSDIYTPTINTTSRYQHCINIISITHLHHKALTFTIPIQIILHIAILHTLTTSQSQYLSVNTLQLHSLTASVAWGILGWCSYFPLGLMHDFVLSCDPSASFPCNCSQHYLLKLVWTSSALLISTTTFTIPIQTTFLITILHNLTNWQSQYQYPTVSQSHDLMALQPECGMGHTWLMQVLPFSSKVDARNRVWL